MPQYRIEIIFKDQLAYEVVLADISDIWYWADSPRLLDRLMVTPLGFVYGCGVKDSIKDTRRIFI